MIVGGVAAGMSAAARLRRLDESASIVVLERDAYVSFASCGLPYHIGGDIASPRVSCWERRSWVLRIDVLAVALRAR